MNSFCRRGLRRFAVAASPMLIAASQATAAGHLEKPTDCEFFGKFGGKAYDACHGRFVGQTATGSYRVPYEVTVRRHPGKVGETVLLEIPHYRLGGAGARDFGLGHDLLFEKVKVLHASVGYSTAFADTNYTPPWTGRFLFQKPQPADPVDPLYIEGADPEAGTDDGILVDFAMALRTDPVAHGLLGAVERVYAFGVSDSSEPLKRVLNGGSGVFDFSLVAGTGPEINPQDAMDAGKNTGKVMVRQGEFEVLAWGAALLRDRHDHPQMYREYEVAGGPHASDVPCLPPEYPLGSLFTNPTTPINWAPVGRALFLAGHRWVKKQQEPPPSLALDGTDSNVARNALGNALGGVRLPAIELDEATFKVGFVGAVKSPRSIGDPGFFEDFPSYAKAFHEAARDLVKAGFLLPEDANALVKRTKLSRPNTFTQNYLDKPLWDSACREKGKKH